MATLYFYSVKGVLEALCETSQSLNMGVFKTYFWALFTLSPTEDRIEAVLTNSF